MSGLEEITTLTLFHFFLIFCRVGSTLMLIPGFGEIYVNVRARLLLALSISFLMTPVLADNLPKLPGDGVTLTLLIMSEIFVGVFIGGIARMVHAVLHLAGMMIAFQSSLAAAVLFDINQGSQGSVIGNFMTIVGLTLLFASNLHHMLFIGIANSYTVFNVGNLPPMGDFASLASKTLSGSFFVAVQIASPLIIVGLCIYLASGIMARLMPNMQVFFVVIPLQILIAFAILALSLSAGMMWYLQHFEETMTNFLY